MRKYFPALTLLLTLLLCVGVRADGPRLEVRLPDRPVEAGEEFVVTVDLTGNPGILSIQFTLAFDKTRMDCENVKIGGLLSEQGAAGAVNPNAASGAKLAAAAANLITGDGQVGVFRFRAKEKLSDFHFSLEHVALDGGASNDGSASSGSGASGNGNASNGSGASGNGSASGGSGASGKGNASNGNGTSGSGSASNGSGASGSGSASGGSGASGNGSASGGSGASGNGSASGGSGASGKGNASNGNGTSGNGSASDSGANGTKPTNTAPSFTDIAGLWAEKYIQTAAARNLFQGYSDGTFRPNNLLTRAQFVTVLWNLAGRPAPSKDAPFTDMAAQIENFRKAVSWAYEKGYVNGTSPQTFSPGEPLTRQAAVKILFAYNGSRRGSEILLTAVYDSQYADSGQISDWAKSAMYWAVYQNILSGTTPTTLEPGGAVTRAQLAAMMVRYTDRFPNS